MRLAIPQPCIGSRESVFNMSRSSVPCSKSVDGGISFDGGIFFLSIFDNRLRHTPVECQGGETTQRHPFCPEVCWTSPFYCAWGRSSSLVACSSPEQATDDKNRSFVPRHAFPGHYTIVRGGARVYTFQDSWRIG